MDESGVEQRNAGSNHFIVLGLAVPISRWKEFDKQIETIKARHALDNVEIHTAWVARRYREQEAIHDFESLSAEQRREAVWSEAKRRSGELGIGGNMAKIKSYRREYRAIAPYVHLTRDERQIALADLAREIGLWSELRVFAEAISKPDFNWQGTASPYEIAFEQIISRFDIMLANFNLNGLIIADNNDTAAPRLTRLCRLFHERGTFYREIRQVIETPLFVDSALTTMIQMADLCAYALRRYIENEEDDLWRHIEPRVDRRGTQLVGLRHFTGRRKCRCPLCIAHGRR
ncbi:DUF3800 domain-containing protein [bacterium]|nr:DUF3800 domain-containing protein [bacterium]